MPRTEMKRSSGFFKGILDGLRSSVSQRSECISDDNLQPELFHILKVIKISNISMFNIICQSNTNID